MNKRKSANHRLIDIRDRIDAYLIDFKALSPNFELSHISHR
ncbi:MAG: hypothetical protein RMY34_26240 [Aulosira sp. DedQUE10]|nr:hypothetical protein [Aulosira sp. DedQUE10]